MKQRLSLMAFVMSMLLIFTSCDGVGSGTDPMCQHRDANDDNKCDKCDEVYTDGKDVEIHIHSYTIKNIDDKYLAASATHESAAIYYYSCSCGEASTTETFTHGAVLGKLTYQLSEDSSFYIVSGMTGVIENVSVPNLYDGLPVFKIEQSAFKDNSTIKSISMPNSIQEIGANAFAGCISLKSIIIPTSVTNISPYTFSGCTSLETVTLHSGIEVLGAFAFEKCTALNSITLNEGLKTISNNAFDNCSSLEGVTIPDTVTTIGNMAFRKATLLKYVNFSKALTSIGNATFQYCTSLKNIELHENITTLGNSTFSDCRGLENLRILGNLQMIGTATFYECRNLEYVYFASKMSSNCGDTNYIFYNAGIDGKGITLTIANGAVIPNGFFTPYVEDNMPKITKIVVEEGNTTVNGFEEYNKLPYLTDITYPETITDSAYGIFNNSLWWDNQPYGEVYISGIFYGYKCDCLLATPDDAVVENKVEATCTKDGVCDMVIYCSVCKKELKRTSTTIISENHKISDGKCTICNLPESSPGLEYMLNSDKKSYTVIGIGNFHGENLVIGVHNNLSVTEIGNSAFYNCSSLTGITISNSVTSISDWAFGGCTNLASITISNSVISIGTSAFSDCTSLTSVTIPTSVTSIGSSAFSDCTSLSSIRIPDSVTSIGESAFSGCTGLDSITIPNGVTYISESTFYNCSNLQSITLPTSVTLIGNNAFYNCSSLKNISLPYRVTSIGDRTFYNCTNLTGISIGSSITSIGDYAFGGCRGLGTIRIPSSVTSIGHGAFYNCTHLYRIEIPDSVTSIGDSAFSGCTNLTIYCEAANKPEGWDPSWNSSNCLVIWAYTGSQGMTEDGFELEFLYGEISIIGYEGTSTEIIIPEKIDGKNVVSIGINAFKDNYSLTSVTIPDSVTSIGGSAFSNCTNLTIYCEAESKPNGWAADWNSSNCLVIWAYTGSRGMTEDGFELEFLHGGISIIGYEGTSTEIIIPEKIGSIDVVAIGDGAFYNKSTLTTITIPDSVTSIGNDAFRNCTSLTSITIPNSVTSIGSSAFSNCTSLASVTIPNSVTTIERNAFSLCRNLTIYCEAEYQPEGWDDRWNPARCPVVWGYESDN